jgi:hypothetical protein
MTHIYASFFLNTHFILVLIGFFRKSLGKKKDLLNILDSFFALAILTFIPDMKHETRATQRQS